MKAAAFPLMTSIAWTNSREGEASEMRWAAAPVTAPEYIDDCSLMLHSWSTRSDLKAAAPLSIFSRRKLHASSTSSVRVSMWPRNLYLSVKAMLIPPPMSSGATTASSGLTAKSIAAVFVGPTLSFIP